MAPRGLRPLLLLLLLGLLCACSGSSLSQSPLAAQWDGRFEDASESPDKPAAKKSAEDKARDRRFEAIHSLRDSLRLAHSDYRHQKAEDDKKVMRYRAAKLERLFGKMKRAAAKEGRGH